VNEDDELDDHVKTGCMGILIPLAVAAYGIYRMMHSKGVTYRGQPRPPDDVIGGGIAALGMALFVHGLGFSPYEKVRFLKYVVAGIGIAVFVYGLTWPH
jgi:hypothetical protein